MLPRPSRLKSLASELSPVLTTPPPVEPNTVFVLMSVPEMMLSSNLVVFRCSRFGRSRLRRFARWRLALRGLGGHWRRGRRRFRRLERLSLRRLGFWWFHFRRLDLRGFRSFGDHCRFRRLRDRGWRDD